MSRGVDLILMWHMHQPDYRVAEGADGAESAECSKGPTFALPWTYLHATKDYVDMVAHLERHPHMRAVVNFVPVLLEQIEDYAAQFASGCFRDPLLRCLARPSLDKLSLAERRLLLDTCFRGNQATMLDPYPQYADLYRIHRDVIAADDVALGYLSGEFYADLIVWYHLVWCGETERRSQPLLARLLAKGNAFDAVDRRELLAVIADMVRGLVARYRALAEVGRIELATSPHAHPLAPLLLDFESARQSQPDVALPTAGIYPGGRTRLLAQLDAAQASHERRFGTAAAGLWPPEGAISAELVRLLASRSCSWLASSESVLANSLQRQGIDFAAERNRHLYRPWKLRDAHNTTLFFRDERLSDLIGFDYANWYGSDATRHFVAELEAIAAAAEEGQRPLVCVILDGENAWEYYPYNGYYFLDHLYTDLVAHPDIRLTTFAEAASEREDCGTLDQLVAGSWVQGNLATWIGHPDKNLAWDLLCSAKHSYDRVLTSGRLDAAQRASAEQQLARCESSDWFWWFGSDHSSASISLFDHLFRRNLRALYRTLGLPTPSVLELPLTRHAADNTHKTQQTPRGGAMVRARAQ